MTRSKCQLNLSYWADSSPHSSQCHHLGPRYRFHISTLDEVWFQDEEELVNCVLRAGAQHALNYFGLRVSCNLHWREAWRDKVIIGRAATNRSIGQKCGVINLLYDGSPIDRVLISLSIDRVFEI